METYPRGIKLHITHIESWNRMKKAKGTDIPLKFAASIKAFRLTTSELTTISLPCG